MNRANLHTNHDMQIIGVVVTVALGIILFEVIPEKSVWSISVKQADEHIIAVTASGGFSLLLMQKQAEQDYKVHVPTATINLALHYGISLVTYCIYLIYFK